MTFQRHDRPHPDTERTFTAVRAALPAANVAAFDTELVAVTHAPVIDLAALDEFLSGWWRIANRAAADPMPGSMSSWRSTRCSLPTTARRNRASVHEFAELPPLDRPSAPVVWG